MNSLCSCSVLPVLPFFHPWKAGYKNGRKTHRIHVRTRHTLWTRLKVVSSWPLRSWYRRRSRRVKYCVENVTVDGTKIQSRMPNDHICQTVYYTRFNSSLVSHDQCSRNDDGCRFTNSFCFTFYPSTQIQFFFIGLSFSHVPQIEIRVQQLSVIVCRRHSCSFFLPLLPGGLLYEKVCMLFWLS